MRLPSISHRDIGLTISQVVLANSSTAAAAHTHSATNIYGVSALPPRTFSNVGLRLNAGGIDFRNTSKWMLDDFNNLDDFPVVPFNN